LLWLVWRWGLRNYLPELALTIILSISVSPVVRITSVDLLLFKAVSTVKEGQILSFLRSVSVPVFRSAEPQHYTQ
jgi:hypothetical protein